MTRPGTAKILATAGLLTAAAFGGATAAWAEERLAFVERETNGVDGVDGLANCVSVKVSADGKNVYASSAGQGAVAVFSRDAGGQLALIDLEQDGVGSVTNLWGAFHNALSPDGENLYVVTRSDSSIVVFTRDPATGALTFVESHVDGQAGVSGLGDAMAPAVSPDGEHVYVAAGNDAVSAFARDQDTGALTFVDSWFDGESSPNGPIAGLNFPEHVVVSDDGAHVYVAGSLSSAVARFSRDAATGLLTYLGATGVSLPVGSALSPDDLNYYVTSGSSVVVYARDPATGNLQFLESKTDGVGGVDGMDGAIAVAVSPTGKLVAVAGRSENAVALFRRDPATGRLTYLEKRVNLVGGVAGLQFVTDVTFAPDDHTLYTAGWMDHAVAAFALVMFGDNFETGDTTGWFTAVGLEP